MTLIDIIQLIQNDINRCKQIGELFSLSPIRGVEIEEIQNLVSGKILLHTIYTIRITQEHWIKIDYKSKDRCEAFRFKPDESNIQITCSNPLLNFFETWEEKY